MPIWLLPLIGKLASALWHAVLRFWSVFLVAAIIAIILLRFHNFKSDIYNLGYKKGYTQCGIDHPTYGSVGTVVNNSNGNYKYIGFKVNVWKLKLGLGI